jgi:phage terminase small subunit
MAHAGTLDAASLPLIERYATQWARWRHAAAKLEAEGVVTIAPVSGVPAISAWHGVARTAAVQCTKLEAELGLAPARRDVRQAVAPLRADGTAGPRPGWAGRAP